MTRLALATSLKSMVMDNANDVDASRHGDGDAQVMKASLNAEQADAVLDHSTRLITIFKASPTYI